jgi:hypothetical protein
MATTTRITTRPESHGSMALETYTIGETTIKGTTKTEVEEGTRKTPPPLTTEAAWITHMKTKEEEEATIILDERRSP